MMKQLIVVIILWMTICSCHSEQKKIKAIQTQEENVQVLLIGSSHWNNYQQVGADVAQTNEIDILSQKYQNELEVIANKIVEFNPDKIFVERTLNYQPKLDSLYNLYKNTQWGEKRRNEIYQLGFRVANKLNHKKVYGIDYRNTSFPYDSLMKAIKKANQNDLISKFKQDIQKYEDDYNVLVREERPLIEIFAHLNDSEERKMDVDWYLSGANQGGDINDNIGSFLASEWMKRNIYSYGLIQKYVEEKDKRIMILMGASHIAVRENLISYNSNWQTVELKDIVEL